MTLLSVHSCYSLNKKHLTIFDLIYRDLESNINIKVMRWWQWCDANLGHIYVIRPRGFSSWVLQDRLCPLSKWAFCLFLYYHFFGHKICCFMTILCLNNFYYIFEPHDINNGLWMITSIFFKLFLTLCFQSA